MALYLDNLNILTNRLVTKLSGIGMLGPSHILNFTPNCILQAFFWFLVTLKHQY